MKRKLTTFSLLALMLIGCIRIENEIPQEPEKQTDIYVAGWDNNQKAAYWKNGVRQPMTKTTSNFYQERTSSMYVINNDVYIVGEETQFHPQEIKKKAKIWKNGVSSYLPNLTEGYQNTDAFSVFVKDNDVYVAGAEYNSNGKGLAILWKNGEPSLLASNRSAANSVYISESDIYIAGFEDNEKGILVAKLWKNGEVIFQTDGNEDAMFISVVISGTDIYLSGREGKIAKIWKNGTPTSVTDSDSQEYFSYRTESLFISGTDVYATGSKYAPSSSFFGKADTALLWKNGQQQILEGQEAYSSDVYVIDNVVYVTGGIGEKGVLWKNGVASELPEGRYTSAVVVTQVEK